MLTAQIGDFISHLAFERSMAANTCEAYSRTLAMFNAWLDARGVSDASGITCEAIVGFLKSERDKGMSSATRAQRSAAIRMFMKYLKATRIIKSDPAELMDSQKHEHPLPRVLSEEETFAMLDAVDGDSPRDVRDRAILETMYGCGLRVSELCEMQLEDIVADGELLRITGKGSKERLVPIGGAAGRALNRYIADDCDGIVTGLYEYDICYRPHFPEKTEFIPYPIELKGSEREGKRSERDGKGSRKLRLFIGINRERSEYKGTDIMLRAAQEIVRKYPEKAELKVAESVPFAEYRLMMDDSDVILDQLYAYTPAMNALEAMSRGLIVVGGGEPENYEIIGETELRPIINVAPNYESVFHELEQLVLHPERIPELKRQSVEYIRRHHDHLKVAWQYEKFYEKLLVSKKNPSKI